MPTISRSGAASRGRTDGHCGEARVSRAEPVRVGKAKRTITAVVLAKARTHTAESVGETRLGETVLNNEGL